MARKKRAEKDGTSEGDLKTAFHRSVDEWARVAAWGALANMAGGLVFVTTLRFAQVGEEKIREEQAGGGGAD